MGFQKLGQQWQAIRLFGPDKGQPVMLRICSYCWLEEREGESGLCPVGEVAVIEDATRYVDDDGNEVLGGLERAELWELLAKRHGLEVPQHLRARRVTKRRKTKKQGAAAKNARLRREEAASV